MDIHRKWIWVCVATMASVSSLLAATPTFPVITNAAQLDAHINLNFTNAFLGKIMPPGISYENNIGLLAYSSTFQTNDLTPMLGATNYGGILLYSFAVTETNSPPASATITTPPVQPCAPFRPSPATTPTPGSKRHSVILPLGCQAQPLTTGTLSAIPCDRP